MMGKLPSSSVGWLFNDVMFVFALSSSPPFWRRRPSTYSCIRVNTLKSTTEAIIDKLASFLDENKLSTNAITSLSLDKKNAPGVGSDASIDPLSIRPSSHSDLFVIGCKSAIYKCPLPGLDNVLFVKGTGPLRVEYGSRQEQPIKEVIVSRKCAEAVLRGAQVSSLTLLINW